MDPECEPETPDAAVIDAALARGRHALASVGPFESAELIPNERDGADALNGTERPHTQSARTSKEPSKSPGGAITSSPNRFRSRCRAAEQATSIPAVVCDDPHGVFRGILFTLSALGAPRFALWSKYFVHGVGDELVCPGVDVSDHGWVG